MTQRHSLQNDRIMLVTTNVQDRASVFHDSACARAAVEALYKAQEIRLYYLYAFVVMPDHCHILLKVPMPGSISRLMLSYKRIVAFDIGKPIWQPRFHIRIPKNPLAARNYIHMNPVRAGIAEISSDYAWSSASGRWDISSLDDVN
ncbi:MAG TPA: transposase [Candidatus Peribacteraceae bacterium]|nr:transposase [Candidatus Peribacteraceae bacterium]